jgi:hypothetical protein
MKASVLQRRLFTSAIRVYLEQSLHATICRREKVQSVSRPGGKAGEPELLKQVENVVLYLQDTIAASLSLESLCGRLAVLDRLEESVLWAMEPQCTTRHGSSAANMYAYSADYLKLVVSREMESNHYLASDWLLASQLCDVAVFLTWREYIYDHTNKFGAVKDSHLGVCNVILSLLSTFPELVIGDRQAIKAKYEFKKSVAEKLQSHEAALEEAQQQHSTAQTDPRVCRLLQVYCAFLTNATHQLGAAYAGDLTLPDASLDLLELYITEQSNLLYNIKLVQEEFRRCRLDAIIDSSACNLQTYEQLCDRRERLFDDVATACTDSAVPPQTSAVLPSDLKSLRDRAIAISGDLYKLSDDVSKLAKHTEQCANYRDRAKEARAAIPFTDLHGKIAECWDRTASAIEADPGSSKRSLQLGAIANLVESVFASAVTCHTQWERAVERKDDKLADFWQRARERAWEAGCEGCSNPSASRELQNSAQEISRAVQLALCTQPVQHQQLTLLMQAEIDLGILAAVNLISLRAEGIASFDYRPRLHVETERVLCMITAHNRRRKLPIGGVPLSPAATLTEDTLNWAAQILCVTNDLHRTNPMNRSVTAVVNNVVEAVTDVPRMLDQPGMQPEMALKMFTTDLGLWALQCRHKQDLVGSWVWDTLAGAYKKSRSVRDSAQRPFLLYLSGALEEALLHASPELRQQMADVWPPQRRLWLAVAASDPTWAQHASKTVDMTLRTLHWLTQLHASVDGEDVLIKKISVHLRDTLAHFEEQAVNAALSKVDGLDGSCEVSATNHLVRSDELVLRALELQYQALELGNFGIQTECAQVCELLESVRIGGSAMLGPSARRPNAPDRRERAQRGLDAMCRLGEIRLCAVAAELSGRGDIVAKWKEAAEVYGQALSTSAKLSPDQRLRSGWEETLQRAEALAEQARRADEEAVSDVAA